MRILAVTSLLVLVVVAGAEGERPDANLQSDILGLRLMTGPWKNAFKDNRDAAGFRYYFVSIGLRAIVSDPASAEAIAAYLDHCLSRAARTGTWDDVPKSSDSQTHLADADDSNAALVILLATDFRATAAGMKWWPKNVAAVKKLAADALLSNRIDTGSGLVAVFAKSRDFTNPSYDPPRSPSSAVKNLDGKLIVTKQSDGDYAKIVQETREFRMSLQNRAYLMDSCEVYGALNSLSRALAATKDSQADEFAKAAEGVAKGINGLFHQKSGAFFVLDYDKIRTPNFYPACDVKFYPHRLAQIFPELYSVPFGDPKATKSRYDAAWQFAVANEDWKPEMPKDCSAGGFPNMIRGYAAFKHGDFELASKHLEWYLRKLDDPKRSPSFVMIHEMGFAEMIRSGLTARQR